MIRLPHTKQVHGFALLVVLILLTLCTVLVTGILLSVTNELRNAKTASNGEGAHQLADAAVQVVIGQLAQATTTGGGTTTWASQPGMIRTYDYKGTEQSNYKLYSSSIMTTNGQLTLAGTAAAGANNVNDYDPAWSSNTALWTDLNAPVVVNESGVTTQYYPIVSGNNLVPDPTPNSKPDSIAYPPPAGAPASITVGVQGFDVDSAKTPVAPTGNVINQVPMPVQWLYQLQDGTLASGTASGANTVTVAGATAANPIIGRIAFWTDDETSKININTACGDAWAPATINMAPANSSAGNPSLTPPGSFWDLPRVYTAFDFNNLPYLQPAQNEFQRYPGHPATVYLSAVFPSFTRDQIFSLTPRLEGGGSEGGTLVAASALNPATSRLYASVDELLFKAPSSPAAPGLRNLNDTSATIIDKATLQQSKFFLTANSRAPEVNLFGKPRIAIWPIDKDVVGQAAAGAQSPRGTAFDNLIAFCSHLGALGSGYDYFFQRTATNSPSGSPSDGYMSPTTDYNIPRNTTLYSYLQTMMSQNIPGFGGNFTQKFGADTNQILTEIFDYIRCVNPSDNILGFQADGITPKNNGANCYTPGERIVNGQSFQDGGYGNDNILTPLSYHAFIVPAQINGAQGLTQGFGRTVTLSEMGLAFICSADGKSTTPSPPGPLAGDGGLSIVVGTTTYYSDFPPLFPPSPTPTAPQIAANPFFKSAPGYSTPTSPGFISSNWNRTLPAYNWSADPTGTHWTGMQPGQRRIEAIFLVNPYTVSPGFSTMHEDLGIEVKGLDSVMGGGFSLFPADGTIVMNNPTNRTPTFGVNWPFFSNSYYVPSRPMPDSTTGQTIGESVPSSFAYPFVSLPFTVTVPTANPKTMLLSSSGTVQVKLWHLSLSDEGAHVLTTPSAPSQLIQTINVDPTQLTSQPFAVPQLMTAIDVDGANNGDDSRENNDEPNPNTNPNPTDNPACGWDFSRQGVFLVPLPGLPGGRFLTVGRGLCDPIFTLSDSIRTLVPGYPTDLAKGTSDGGDYRLLAATNVVPTTVFVPHRYVHDNPTYNMQHSFIDMGQNCWHLEVQGADLETYSSSGISSPFGALITSTPPLGAFGGVNSLLPVKTGDFDNGYGSDMDGPYINKPDDGCNFDPPANQANGYIYPYFGHFADEASATFFSPNRQISSPGMFGSLPVGVMRHLPWQTLLFRPQPGHPDGVPVPDVGTSNGGTAPYPGTVADHLMMDLFWMPVVEPYAISEPFSTAGKINLNYQIAPFTYITRATALDALLKSQRMLAIPNLTPANSNYKAPVGYSSSGATPNQLDFRSDLNLSPVSGTLRQFEEKFASGDIFRSPTQICDIYLTPSTQSWNSNSQAVSFWAANQPTGDNSRERPYANLYGCLTTKSNTYTVHFRVQTLKKTLNTPAGQWVDNKDVVASDYRGSTLIERYVDTSDTTLPDFATTPGANLDTYYKFRVLSTRKFSP